MEKNLEGVAHGGRGEPDLEGDRVFGGGYPSDTPPHLPK